MAMYGTKLPYRPTEADRDLFTVGRGWEPDEVQGLLDRTRAKPPSEADPFSVPPQVLLHAIDPATGDSLLHIAAQAASADAVNKIMDRFGCEQRRFYVWAHHALLAHQNHSGDTAFHVATRSGNQMALTALYRHAFEHWSAFYPEEMVMDDGPPEHMVYPEDIEGDYSAPALLFLITKNKMGRDPAAEARHAGQDDVAQWLDDVVLRLDSDGTRRTEAHVDEMIALVKYEKWHDLMAERQGQQE